MPRTDVSPFAFSPINIKKCMTAKRHHYDSSIHHRQSIRLKGYDYCQPGFYFITMNTYHWKKLFGRICHGTMVLNEFGKIIEEEWKKAAIVRTNVSIDTFQVMPDHFHGIIEITPGTPVGVKRRFTPSGAAPGSVGAIVSQFKMQTTKRIKALYRKAGEPPPARIWQRDYYDQIIWNDLYLQNIRRYIMNNPKNY
jgi:putative transposase